MVIYENIVAGDTWNVRTSDDSNEARSRIYGYSALRLHAYASMRKHSECKRLEAEERGRHFSILGSGMRRCVAERTSTMRLNKKHVKKTRVDVAVEWTNQARRIHQSVLIDPTREVASTSIISNPT